MPGVIKNSSVINVGPIWGNPIYETWDMPITVSITSYGWRDRSLDQANWTGKWSTTLGYSSPFCFGNYWTMWKLAGVDTLHHSCYWSKCIVAIQLMSIKLIFEKYRALIALVIKFYYRWDLSYTLNTSYYTAFYKHPNLLVFMLREESFLRFFKAVLKLGSLSFFFFLNWFIYFNKQQIKYK